MIGFYLVNIFDACCQRFFFDHNVAFLIQQLWNYHFTQNITFLPRNQLKPPIKQSMVKNYLSVYNCAYLPLFSRQEVNGFSRGSIKCVLVSAGWLVTMAEMVLVATLKNCRAKFLSFMCSNSSTWHERTVNNNIINYLPHGHFFVRPPLIYSNKWIYLFYKKLN